MAIASFVVLNVCDLNPTPPSPLIYLSKINNNNNKKKPRE